ncbi:MAG: Acylphosphatase, putative [Methanothrix harundinacea]|uniref:Acylphosphatase, putative n=1 Tax=Methanothrix harundinacea TaxID=301375 RepID=A0A101FS75_9EURY|nr:MAG: Acylphosphatase, putative [Methanothrix harundinacea]
MMDKNNRIQDQMLDRQDETTGEVRGLRSDLKESLDVRLDRMEADLGESVVGSGGEGQPLTA